MTKTLIAVLIAAQTLTAAGPAFAASLNDQPTMTQQSRGAFAGLRLRLPLDGQVQVPQAGLAFTAVQRSEASDGSSRLHFSEGVEFGFTGSSTKPQLMLAGLPVNKLRAAEGENAEGENEDKGHGGVSTVVIVIGGLLVAGAIGAAIYAHELQEASY